MKPDQSIQTDQEIRRRMRVVMLCVMAIAAGLIMTMTLVLAVRSWHGEGVSNLFDFVMPVVFAFLFYRLVGSAFAAITGTLAPWSYEALFKNHQPPSS